MSAKGGSVGVGQLGAEAGEVGLQGFLSMEVVVDLLGGPVVTFLPELGLGAQVFVSVRTIFVDEGAEVVVSSGLFDDVLPERLKILEGSFERGQGRDSVHERAEVEPVNPFRP